MTKKKALTPNFERSPCYTFHSPDGMSYWPTAESHSTCCCWSVVQSERHNNSNRKHEAAAAAAAVAAAAERRAGLSVMTGVR